MMPLLRVKKDMDTHEEGFGTLRFSLLGIPIEIRLSTWILLSILGGAFSVNDGASLASTLIFVVAGALCLLAHEMGHALTGRYFTHFSPWVTLGGLGGVTYYPVAPRTRAQYFATTLAGPMASFLMGAILALAMGIQCGDIPAGIYFYLCAPFGQLDSIPPQHLLNLLTTFYTPLSEGYLTLSFLGEIYQTALAISMWWTLFNLLPILPLDGGHLLHTLSGNIKLTTLTGIGLCLLLIVASISFGLFLTGILAVYFAIINIQILRGHGNGDPRED